jgi:hypothetical protein
MKMTDKWLNSSEGASVKDEGSVEKKNHWLNVFQGTIWSF